MFEQKSPRSVVCKDANRTECVTVSRPGLGEGLIMDVVLGEDGVRTLS